MGIQTTGTEKNKHEKIKSNNNFIFTRFTSHRTQKSIPDKIQSKYEK